MSKVAMVLSGSGFYDGSEIQEVVMSMLVLDNLGIEVQCFAPDIDQYHVINHLTGGENQEKRNVLEESARIARGNVLPLNKLSISDFSGLVLPGGFGTAKNLSSWAFDGSEGTINTDLIKVINKMIALKKPIAAMCMAPTLVARALKGKDKYPQLTVGSFEKPSPYNIKEIADEMKKCGITYIQMDSKDSLVDSDYRIVSTPAYMMEASMSEVFEGIEKTLTAFANMMNMKV